MTLALLGLLALFLMDRKETRILLCCLLPAFLALPAFFKTGGLQDAAFLSGAVLLCASPVLEWASGRIGTVCPKEGEEDIDILSQKGKWRLILAGYAVIILFMIFAIFSILRLNSKLNSLHDFSQNQQLLVNEQAERIKELQDAVSKLQSGAEDP